MRGRQSVGGPPGRRSEPRAGPPALSRQWLERRIELLDRYCLPSIAAQTSERFAWLVFCDETTAPEAMERLKARERQLPTMRIVETTLERTFRTVTPPLVEPDTDVLITTRLDSDDALADRYVEAVQEYADSFHRSTLSDLLVNFPRGCRLDARTGTLYDSHMPNSPCHSLLERPRAAPVKTVMSGGHAFLHERHVTHQDESMLAWLLVIHGGNVSNRIPPSARPRAGHGGLPGFTLGPGALRPPIWRSASTGPDDAVE